MDDFRRPPVNRLADPGAPKPVQPQPQPKPQPQLPPQPQPRIQPQAQVQPQAPQTFQPQPISPVNGPTLQLTQPLKPEKKPRSKKRRIVLAVTVLIGLLITALASVMVWYQIQLTPVDAKSSTKELVTIEAGSLPAQIASTLEEKKLIRSQVAFLWYTRLNGTQNNLQAGTYRLSASESIAQIASHLTNGTVDTFDMTFLPGATVSENKKVFLNAGFSQQEVAAAFSATYDSPLFADKPASADLEGYIYGDTYKFGAGASAKEVLEHVFESFYTAVQKNGLIAAYQVKGLTLYQGITLASIIQRESGGGDEAQIAQVFYSRLAQNIPLGSDVTYQYIADKLGVARDPNLDSPYNTRRYPGLPPGPIATPGLTALKATANPAPGDYLFFLSGDDDVTYFARTLAEHDANIAAHCKVKCQIL